MRREGRGDCEKNCQNIFIYIYFLEERVRPFLHDSPDFVPGREKNGKKKEVFISHCDDSLLFLSESNVTRTGREKSSRTFSFIFISVFCSPLFSDKSMTDAFTRWWKF
ncbi:hypothetical protein CDAR_200841 [Caerostris darwini]|uniref:Uncharacterized protein n=1 Tax=Caerostris darwini TaxID=1538125 RepID=A0AAV4Q3I3_9ARAC|nr:hypothetical protein CDAR_200841 [Caerostris darwini]